MTVDPRGRLRKSNVLRKLKRHVNILLQCLFLMHLTIIPTRGGFGRTDDQRFSQKIEKLFQKYWAMKKFAHNNQQPSGTFWEKS